MRFGHIACNRLDDLLVFIQHDVQDKVSSDDRGRFLDVLTDRIGIDIPGIGAVLYHPAVVGLYGIPGGHTGHERFGAARITGKVVVLNISDQDPPVRFRDGTDDVNRRSSAGLTHVHHIIRIAVDAFHFAVGPLAREVLLLLFGVLSVTAECKHNRDVFFLHTGRIEFIEEHRHDHIGRAGPRNVARDDNDLLSRLHDPAKLRRTDRVPQSISHLIRTGSLIFHRVRQKHLLQILVIYFNRLCTAAETDFHFHWFSP